MFHIISIIIDRVRKKLYILFHNTLTAQEKRKTKNYHQNCLVSYIYMAHSQKFRTMLSHCIKTETMVLDTEHKYTTHTQMVKKNVTTAEQIIR
jgi:hypothetical protein